jgi:hypothetical protein
MSERGRSGVPLANERATHHECTHSLERASQREHANCSIEIESAVVIEGANPLSAEYDERA